MTAQKKKKKKKKKKKERKAIKTTYDKCATNTCIITGTVKISKKDD